VTTETATPYESADEHLTDLLTRHDWLLKRQLARSRSRQPVDMVGFAATSEEEVQRLLDERTSMPSPAVDAQLIDWTLRHLDQEIAGRVEQSMANGVELPFMELAREFGLLPLEIDLLVPCIAVELDRRYERVYGFLHDDMTRRLASPGLVASLYGDSVAEQLRVRALLGAHAPLRRYRLLDVLDDPIALPSSARPMRADERIVAFVAGERTVDRRIASGVTWIDGIAVKLEKESATSPSGTEFEAAVDRIVSAAKSRHPEAIAAKPFIYLQGAAHHAGAIVAAAAARLKRLVLVADLEPLLDAAADVESAFFLLLREALLNQAAVYLRNVDRVLDGPLAASRYRALLRAVDEMGSVVFASGERRWAWPLPNARVALRIVALQPEGVAAQIDAWRSVAGDRFNDGELYRLISLHPMPVASIVDVWRMAQAMVLDDGVPTLSNVQDACRDFGGTPMSTLARRVEPKHRMSDLVLPAAQLEQLAAICSQARHSSIVYGAWRFDRKLSLGRGLNAMFTGQPGTGKTMAAEVIAAELGVELLKIDLSQIVSKYIGETEKNLRELFDQAARAHAILFFDEADALLGKRSDVKDAHDRYANTETAYLLQKMEEYPGITILATNLRQNMDAAFTRRMRFIVDFPFPDEADRLRIWESVWPAEVPLGPDVDLPLLARQFRLAGGSIRNVAVAAAFLAAEQEQSVSMRHLMLATKRELQKMGRLVDASFDNRDLAS
jgi:hypothetical protein